MDDCQLPNIFLTRSSFGSSLSCFPSGDLYAISPLQQHCCASQCSQKQHATESKDPGTCSNGTQGHKIHVQNMESHHLEGSMGLQARVLHTSIEDDILHKENR